MSCPLVSIFHILLRIPIYQKSIDHGKIEFHRVYVKHFRGKFIGTWPDTICVGTDRICTWLTIKKPVSEPACTGPKSISTQSNRICNRGTGICLQSNTKKMG